MENCIIALLHVIRSVFAIRILRTYLVALLTAYYCRIFFSLIMSYVSARYRKLLAIVRILRIALILVETR